MARREIDWRLRMASTYAGLMSPSGGESFMGLRSVRFDSQLHGRIRVVCLFCTREPSCSHLAPCGLLVSALGARHAPALSGMAPKFFRWIHWRYLVEGAHVLRIKFKVASQFHHLLKIKTCCNAAMGHWGQSGVEMTEILVRLGGDLFAGAEVLFDGGDADFKLHPEQVVAGYEIRGGVQVGFRATGSVRPTQRRHQRMRRSFYSVPWST
jgi:hypothetical protein